MRVPRRPPQRVHLADLDRLYQQVDRGTAFSTALAKARFFSAFGTGALDTSDPAERIDDVVAEEAAAQGKSLIAAAFTARVRAWHAEGSYDICPPSGCGSIRLYRVDAGLVSLPVKVRGGFDERRFVSSRFVNDLPVACAAGQTCAVKTQAETVGQRLDGEILRAQIRSALLSW